MVYTCVFLVLQLYILAVEVTLGG